MATKPKLDATLPTPTAFDFPYPQPYAIQLELMQTVFRAIEDRKIAIVIIKHFLWRLTTPLIPSGRITDRHGQESDAAHVNVDMAGCKPETDRRSS